MLRTTDPHSMYSCWAQGPIWKQASCKSGNMWPRAVVLFPLASHPSMGRLSEIQKGEFEPVSSQEWRYHPCQGHIWHLVRDLGNIRTCIHFETEKGHQFLHSGKHCGLRETTMFAFSVFFLFKRNLEIYLLFLADIVFLSKRVDFYSKSKFMNVIDELFSFTTFTVLFINSEFLSFYCYPVQ